MVQLSPEKFHYLLGHKGYALKGLAEASPRTNLVDNLLPSIHLGESNLENALQILEQLLAQPSRIHNRDKLQRMLLQRNKSEAKKNDGDASWSTIRKMGQN